MLCKTANCPCLTDPNRSLSRVVYLHGVGGYAVMRRHALTAVADRLLWNDLRDLQAAAANDGLCLSDFVANTAPA